ncbi:MAG: hypothetical protein U1E30_17215 [Rhodoblastus sp.]
MSFFLTEILARIVAAYLAVDCARKLLRGLSEGKIAIFNPDLLDWFSYKPADRNATPAQFWIEMGLQAIMLVSCIAVAIFGWFRPGA